MRANWMYRILYIENRKGWFQCVLKFDWFYSTPGGCTRWQAWGLVALALAVAPALSATTSVLTVNSHLDTSDLSPGDGSCDTTTILVGDQCTLRAAIEELNAQGPDVSPHEINFNIPGSGPFTILPASPLPAIEVPVEILGINSAGRRLPQPHSNRQFADCAGWQQCRLWRDRSVAGCWQ